MGGVSFPLCCLTWGQMLELMKILVTTSISSSKGPIHTLLQSVCSQPLCCKSLPTHASARDSWTLTGKSGSGSCGLTAPFSLVLVCKKLYLFLRRACFPVLCKFWWLYGGVNGDLLQEGLCHTQVCCTQIPCPWSSPLLTCTWQETLKHSPVSVSMGLWVLVHPRFFLSPLSISGGYWVWF